jgi:tetratricopeptide (TPR) repeat protein
LGGSLASAAQSSKLKNVDLSNGVDRTTADPQINGCTALIESGKETPQTLAIVYNNRGNAYSSKGKYDLAPKDYDKSIELNPNYARAFNNRGVVYQKRRI